MAVKQQISAPDGTYFITITCFNWLHLFEISNSYDCVYKWFNVLKKGGHYINGYVIMPNHLHALISFVNTGKSITTIIGNGKRFLAYDIVERLQETNNEIILTKLSNAVKPLIKKEGSFTKYSKILLIIKNASQKNSFYKSLITFIGIRAAENGILQLVPRNMCIALQAFTSKECRGFFRLMISCK